MYLSGFFCTNLHCVAFTTLVAIDGIKFNDPTSGDYFSGDF